MQTDSAHMAESSGKPVPFLAYAAPIAVFFAVTFLEAQFRRQYVPVYILKAALVTCALLIFRQALRDIRFDLRVVPAAIGVGLIVFIVWVWLPQIIPYPPLGKRVGYNPFQEIEDPALRALFLAVRFYGLVLMVPVMEELFWRSFLLRYVTLFQKHNPTPEELHALPKQSFSWMSFWIVAGAFGLAHTEWLAAIFCAAAYGLLLKRTGSIFACVVAHLTSNLALGLYILQTGAWHFW